MKDSAKYVKIIEWSDKDQCFIGSCPGDNEQEVFTELCEIVEETIALYKEDGKPLPAPTSGKEYVSKMLSIA